METLIETPAYLEDQELIENVLRRMPDALENLHRKYRTVLRSVIMQVLHDECEADDVLQEVFLQVWNRAESYSPRKGRLVSWLCTLARRRAIDRLRQHSAYQRATDRYEVSCLHVSREPDKVHIVENEACREEMRELLKRQLETLPPCQEQAVRMAFLEDRSQREISALTHTPLGTVKTRIELGIKKLARAFRGMRAEVL